MKALHIMMLSVHGLLRGREPELGRDADTGGQILYVLELARALGRHPSVAQVDVITRLIDDPAVGADYARPEEDLGEGVRILRFPFGPARYLRKETLWNHLDFLVDRVAAHIRREERIPDVIHSHYADSGYAGVQLSQLLGVPLVHTGHSLGRCKRQRLLDLGRKAQAIDRQFNFTRRIAAEEEVLAHASLVVTSTAQECEEQYGLYDSFQRARAVVIAPGTDTSRFRPPSRQPVAPRVIAAIDRFLEHPRRPLILAISRPEMRKNLVRLVAAYASSAQLRDTANLAIVAGQRDDLRELDPDQATVLTELLLEMDRHDLWGKVALPKHHAPDDVPELYRLAAARRGVFANPALTEPFGLTLIEAAASGLPVVATADGGPKDILACCDNGVLVDPLDTASIAHGLEEVLADSRAWQRRARRGLSGVARNYTWEAHVNKYLKHIERMLKRARKRLRRERASQLFPEAQPFPLRRRLLISDIDNTLLGDRDGLDALLELLRRSRGELGFGIATGRPLESALRVLKQWRVPQPGLLITSVGSEIHYGSELQPDIGWRNHIRHLWRRDALRERLATVPGLREQAKENQREFKLSYDVVAADMPPLRELRKMLRMERLHANLVYSHERFLDVLPARASKGRAVRYLAYKWGIDLSDVLVAGDSGNDEEMLLGNTLGVVVGNHSPEMEALRGRDQIYFAQARCASGIVEGIRHYRFVDTSVAGEVA